MTAVRSLAERFQLSADAEMLVTLDGRRLTYRDVRGHAEFLAGWARDGGLRPGDTICVELANSPEFVVWYFACFFGGFVMVPVNPELSAEDKAHILSVASPKLTVNAANMPVLGSAVPSALPPTDWSDDAVGVIFFTSGTTDRPKGVMHSWSSLIANVMAFNEQCGLGPKTRMLHVLPMAYMAGFLNTVLSPVMAGGTVIEGPRFGPQSLLDFWSLPLRERVNAIWITPSIAAALLRAKRDVARAHAAVAGFEHIFCGTAPLHDTVRRDFLAGFGKPLQESYGTSEQMLLSVQSVADATTLRNVGQPLKTADLAFAESEPGIAEIHVASRHLGYLTADGVLAPAIGIDGRTPTGDAGRLVDGRLEITGRLKDLIIRGGINVSPVAVENALGETDGVKDIAVIGVPHPFWGESIVACLEVLPGVDEAAVIAAVELKARERLGKAFRPDRICVVKAFPRATTGKIQKRLLREDFAE